MSMSTDDFKIFIELKKTSIPTISKWMATCPVLGDGILGLGDTAEEAIDQLLLIVEAETSVADLRRPH